MCQYLNELGECAVRPSSLLMALERRDLLSMLQRESARVRRVVVNRDSKCFHLSGLPSNLGRSMCRGASRAEVECSAGRSVGVAGEGEGGVAAAMTLCTLVKSSWMARERSVSSALFGKGMMVLRKELKSVLIDWSSCCTSGETSSRSLSRVSRCFWSVMPEL